MGELTILDSTLREGAQAEGISFSVADKMAIARELDRLGIGYIEAGNPASNPKDREFFARAGELKLQNAKIVAFGATRHKDIAAQDDEGLAALLSAGTETVTIFGKSDIYHVHNILCTEAGENLDMITSSCELMRKSGRQVFFDAEHFFDGYKRDRDFALETLRAALRGGASMLVLCDTKGGAFPDEIYSVTAEVRKAFPDACIGIHCHNDSDMAVAGCLMAVRAGASHIQGTLLGVGERCGNARLSSVIPNLLLKAGYTSRPAVNCELLTPVSRIVAEVCNTSIKRYEPYIGRSAFAHKAGMHADAVRKDPTSFEQISPESVGNERRMPVSEISGRGAMLEYVRRLIPDATKDSRETGLITERLKELEYQGYQFEAAQASLDIMMRRCVDQYTPFFELCNYRIICQNPHDPDCSAAAMVKVRVGGDEVLRSAEGHGPVHALDKALRFALIVFYPQLSDVHLTDYKVRVMDSQAATAATVRVSISSTDGRHEWTTVGMSQDLIEASFAALCDSIEYKLISDSEK